MWPLWFCHETLELCCPNPQTERFENLKQKQKKQLVTKQHITYRFLHIYFTVTFIVTVYDVILKYRFWSQIYSEVAHQ